MATPLSQTFAVDALPIPLRNKCADLLLSGKSTRAVSAFLQEHGHKVSHSAVARYKRLSLAPAIKTAAKVQSLQQASETSRQHVQESAALTRDLLAAAPILRRTEWMWSEIQEGVQESKAQWVASETGEKTYVAGDLKARAALLNVARGVTETEAKALQLPGFTSTPQVNITNQQIVVMPASQPAYATGEVIDVEAEE